MASSICPASCPAYSGALRPARRGQLAAPEPALPPLQPAPPCPAALTRARQLAGRRGLRQLLDGDHLVVDEGAQPELQAGRCRQQLAPIQSASAGDRGSSTRCPCTTWPGAASYRGPTPRAPLQPAVVHTTKSPTTSTARPAHLGDEQVAGLVLGGVHSGGGGAIVGGHVAVPARVWQ